MNCPVCNVKLQMADRHGVEINYCPDCRSVWIDRGGLDKIIDRSRAHAPDSRFSKGDRKHHEQARYHKVGGRRRKSLFSDLFD